MPRRHRTPPVGQIHQRGPRVGHRLLRAIVLHAQLQQSAPAEIQPQVRPRVPALQHQLPRKPEHRPRRQPLLAERRLRRRLVCLDTGKLAIGQPRLRRPYVVAGLRPAPFPRRAPSRPEGRRGHPVDLARLPPRRLGAVPALPRPHLHARRRRRPAEQAHPGRLAGIHRGRLLGPRLVQEHLPRPYAQRPLLYPVGQPQPQTRIHPPVEHRL